MMPLILLMMVVLASLIALRNWRWGWLGMVVVALLQDPFRKLSPGAPALMVLSTIPIWLCALAGAWRQRELSFREFRASYPFQWRLVVMFCVSLIVPALLSLTYGDGSWQFTLLGLFTQVALFGGIVLGYHFPLRLGDIAALMKWYCLLAVVMMIGAPLEKFQIGVESGLTGTRTLDACWVTYRTGKALFMISGFFRSPDLLGWHAAMLVMFSTTLALRSRRWGRWLWIVLAGIGCVALMYCARRKMIAMVPVFGLSICFMQVLLGHLRSLPRLVILLGAMLCAGIYTYTLVGSDADVEKFYATTVDEFDDRVQSHGFAAVVETYKQAGFWGHGLGMAVQGVHHVKAKRPRIWQESGPSVIMAELGVPGLVAGLALLVGFLFAGVRSLRRSSNSSEYPLLLGLASVVIANIAAGVVSSQIFGDPFIACFMPFLAGLVLSGSRLEPTS